MIDVSAVKFLSLEPAMADKQKCHGQENPVP